MDESRSGRGQPSHRRRLDVLLVERGLFPSRARAQAAVLAGHVYVDGRRAAKPGEAVAADARLEVRGDPLPYASRGGLKLVHALDVFAIDVAGRVAVDVGASTGGFTHVLLERGARRVYAVDVGYGQLAWRLRSDPRVVVMDRTNARYLVPEMFPEPPDLAVVDVSFISVAKLLPALAGVLAPPGDVVVLIKPQFEAGPERVGKGGIVRDADVHVEVMVGLAREARSQGFAVRAMTYSPVRGGAGNLEFFQWWSLGGSGTCPAPGVHERLGAQERPGAQEPPGHQDGAGGLDGPALEEEARRAVRQGWERVT